jgi:hypothetical protein
MANKQTNKQSSKDLRGIRSRLDKFMDASMHYQVEVCIPKTLKKSFLVAHTPAEIKEDRWVSFAYYIVSRVLLATLNKDFKRTKTGKGRSKQWVSVPIAVFQEMGASKYAVLRKQLLDLEILECDSEYSYRNHETYGYRLGKAFRKQPIKFRTIKSPSIKKVLLDRRRADLKLAKPLLREIAFVAKGWLNHDHIELDKHAARHFLGLYHSIMRIRLERRLSHIKNKEKRDELRTQVENRYLHALYQVKKWGKEPTLSVDGKGGRFYTPLVSLLSTLRNFITFEGQPLVSFDIKNSQPLHLLLLLNKEFWAEDSRLTWSLRRMDADLWQEIWAHPSERAQEAVASLSIEFKKRTLRPDGKRVVNTHFADLVLAGNSYEFMVEQFRGKYITKEGKDRFGTRELAKREMLKMMYFDSKNPPTRKHPFKTSAGCFRWRPR